MQHPLIVVVDDNTDYLSFITTLLASVGYTVLSCHQSAAALPLIRARQPDVVLLDIRMEQQHSGLEVIAQIRADATTTHIPVLLCSADVETLHAFAATNHDAHTETLAKPFELPHVLSILARIRLPPNPSP